MYNITSLTSMHTHIDAPIQAHTRATTLGHATGLYQLG